jgi:type IV pilus assembly protein PilV
VNRTLPSRRRGQRGAGLIEVLVAVLVLSFGMLGLAGLQMSALRNNQSSLERGVAVMMTHSIADAMRADRSVALANGFNLAVTADPPSGATFAQTALRNWRTNITNAFGAGADAKGGVNCNGASCTITIQWSDTRITGDTAATQSITTVVLL